MIRMPSSASVVLWCLVCSACGADFPATHEQATTDIGDDNGDGSLTAADLDTVGDSIADVAEDGTDYLDADAQSDADGLTDGAPTDGTDATFLDADALPDGNGASDADGGPDTNDVDAYPDGYWISTSCVNRCGQPPKWGACNCDGGCVGAGDCCGDFAALCGVTNVCGNGTCEAGEDAVNCPSDCPKLPPPIVPCLQDKCPGPWAGCWMDTQCTTYLGCYATCLDDSVTPAGTVWKCMDACKNQPQFSVTAAEWAEALSECGYKSGCWLLPTTFGAVCGDGACWPTEKDCDKDCGPTKPLPVCGINGCYASETWFNCPECGYLPSTTTDDCLIAKCGAQWQTCSTAGLDCMTPVKCVEAGASTTTCVKAGTPQTATDLLSCGTATGCLKDNSAFSCQGSCGLFLAGMPCACSSECKQLSNCCADFDATCNGAVLCGDGVCNSLGGETSATCPADCGTAATKPCTGKSDCAAAEVCCAKTGGKWCVAAGTCL